MHNQVAELYNPLLGYVKKRVRNHEDAEDLTQDVFFKLAKSQSADIHNLKNWVYTIAKNTITDYYRKNQLRTKDLTVESFFDDESIEDAGQELGKCVGSFVKQLPEEYRELLILSELNEISQKEIAKMLDMNYVTVRSKIQRGRKKLKELIEGCCSVLQGGKGGILDYKSKGPNKTSSCD